MMRRIPNKNAMSATSTLAMNGPMHKLGLRKNLADPAKDSVADASLHAERPQQAEFILVETNDEFPPLADESSMATFHRAGDALEMGDIDTALALSAEVIRSNPTYWLAQKTFLEAYALSANCDRAELMARTFDTIRGLENQRLGLLPEESIAKTTHPVSQAALAFEESRHWFNLGDDYESLSDGPDREANLRRAAACFRQSRALLDPGKRAKMISARLLREALVQHRLNAVQIATGLIEEACGIDPGYVVSFVRARPYMKPLLVYLRNRSQMP